MNVHPDPATTAPAKPLMSERRVGVLGALLVAMGPISMSMFTPAMPVLVEAFGSTDAVVKLTLSLYFAGFAFAQLVCGPLSDGFGRKPVTMVFVAIYVAASLIALLAPSVELLIFARFLQGVGGAVGVAIARAIVRDLFTNERSARIMNLIGMILGVGPAFAPTLGGIALELWGWQAIFALMLLMGLVIMAVVHVALIETVRRDLSRIRPLALMRSYRQLSVSGYFMSSSIVLGGAVGTLYTLATLLPFILMNEVGLSASAFGLGMLAQSGSFFAGSIAVRSLMGRMNAYAMVPVGLVFVAVGSVLIAALLRIWEPGFLMVMGPVAIYTFGIAFIMPAMSTAALAPFPHMAGAAASMSGFLQMGGGLVGGAIAMLFDDPVVAMATIVPGMGLVAILSWAWWRALPEPAFASTLLGPRDEAPPT